MMFDKNAFIIPCDNSKNIQSIKLFGTTLLLSAFIVIPAFAETTTPEINSEYLNSLTSPKVTWVEASSSDTDIVLINGAYYKYTYHQPDSYTETNTRFDPNTNANTQSVVFEKIANTTLIKI